MSKLFKKWAKCEYGMNDGMCAYHNGCDCMAVDGLTKYEFEEDEDTDSSE